MEGNTGESKYEKEMRDFLGIWKYGHPEFYKLVAEMCRVHERKNKAYGGGNSLGNFMESERFGIPAWKGILVRISDKVTRIYNMARELENPEYADAMKEENIKDSLLDLAGYSLLCIVMLGERKSGKEESKE